MGPEQRMDQRKIEKIQGLIERGFYDDPGILAVLLDRCIEAIIRAEDGSRANQRQAPAISRPRAGRARRVRVRPARRKRCGAAAG
jgi:hypothetical protein